MGIVSITQILFIAGKIFGFLPWSWWLVFSPAIVYFSFWFSMFGVAVVVALEDRKI